MKKVIILTGPGGSGKTTIAKFLKNDCGYTLVDGDHEDTEFFPLGNQWLPENSENLRKAHDKILNKVKGLVESGKRVVVDYIIFGHYLEFFDKFRATFGNDLQIAVLFPRIGENLNRDKNRECWTTGKNRIESVRCEFEKIRGELGSDNYIDTSGQTPKETFLKYFNV